MEQQKIIYTADFFLDSKALLSTFPPKHKTVFRHHYTIAFKPDSLGGVEFGKKFFIKILARVFDQKGDSLLVENQK